MIVSKSRQDLPKENAMKSFLPHLGLFLALAIPNLGQEACAEALPSPAATATPKAIPLSGKVLETMESGGYTYVLLKTREDKVWVAIPLMKVSVGQEMTLSPGYEMKDFKSQGLNRKFDRLIFSAGIVNHEVKLSPSALKMLHEGVPKGAAPRVERPAPQKSAPVAGAKVAKSYTIAQLYAKKTNLEKKPIVVRGRVVKVSPRIMKRNWVHIRDGSGSEARKNNNLVITSEDLPKVGDLVTASGTLYNNIDFGSGYRYDLIIENARFK